MPRIFPNLKLAIKDAAQTLHLTGKVVETERWHAQKAPQPMHECLFYSFHASMPACVTLLVEQTECNYDWAEEHFGERVSGLPLNPPPSHVRWPYAQKDNAAHKTEVFSHTYPERMWPVFGNAEDLPGYEKGDRLGAICREGIHYRYGDTEDLIKLLKREPYTRQAFLPIWFPEDTGAVKGQRVPCTIGYQFLRRAGYLHCIYTIRSCDFFRHFRDDIYLTVRLVMWMIEQCGWSKEVVPGILAMNIGSLHCLESEAELLKHHAQ